MKHHTFISGSYVQDLTFYVDSFPLPGETRIGNFANGAGGKGSNQAVACHRSGGTVFFNGTVGNDIYGNFAKDFYSKENIPCNFHVNEKENTGVAGILVDSKSQNEIVVALGANQHMPINDLTTYIQNAKLVVTQFETNMEAVHNVFDIAEKYNVPVILNPAPMRDDAPKSLINRAYLITPNESEFVSLCILFNKNFKDSNLPQFIKSKKQELVNQVVNYSVDEWKVLLDASPFSHILITLGSKGSLYYKRGVTILLTPCVPNIKPVDSTGAGDAFMGGLCTGIEKYGFNNMLEAIKYATAVAALSVTKRGTAPAMPFEKEVKDLLEDNKR